MQCANCGHQSSSGATFCLNCGTKHNNTVLGQVGSGGTFAGPTGLPASTRGTANKICMHCQADNACNMKFCRQCGSPFGEQEIPSQQLQPQVVSAPVVLPQPAVAPVSASRPRSTSPTPPAGVKAQVSQPVTVSQRCPSCQGETPGGFSFCQRCGKPLPKQELAAPIASPQSSYSKPVAVAAPVLDSASYSSGHVPAIPSPRPVANSSGHVPAIPSPRPVANSSGPVAAIPGPEHRPVANHSTPLEALSWGALVSVKRNGSDGEIYRLQGDYMDVGKAMSCALQFTDPFLAPCHARLEPIHGSVRITGLEALNGVYYRLRHDTELVDGAIILLGRELLRFEMLGERERQSQQLLQHGVCLFGSPQRSAFARVMQLMPNGAIGDVRHLYGDEVVVGREEGTLVYGDDEFLSRCHASFRWKNGRCLLSDLGSSNGTFLRITEPLILKKGDFLRVGDQMFRYEEG